MKIRSVVLHEVANRQTNTQTDKQKDGKTDERQVKHNRLDAVNYHMVTTAGLLCSNSSYNSNTGLSNCGTELHY